MEFCYKSPIKTVKPKTSKELYKIIKPLNFSHIIFTKYQLYQFLIWIIYLKAMKSEQSQSPLVMEGKNSSAKKSSYQTQILNLYYKSKKSDGTVWYENELELMSEEIGLTKNQIYKYLWNKKNRDSKINKELDEE